MMELARQDLVPLCLMQLLGRGDNMEISGTHLIELFLVCCLISPRCGVLVIVTPFLSF